MRITSFATSMSRLRSMRRTALLAAAHWDDMRSAAPGLADQQHPMAQPADPNQLEMPMSREAPPPS